MDIATLKKMSVEQKIPLLTLSQELGIALDLDTLKEIFASCAWEYDPWGRIRRTALGKKVLEIILQLDLSSELLTWLVRQTVDVEDYAYVHCRALALQKERQCARINATATWEDALLLYEDIRGGRDADGYQGIKEAEARLAELATTYDEARFAAGLFNACWEPAITASRKMVAVAKTREELEEILRGRIGKIPEDPCSHKECAEQYRLLRAQVLKRLTKFYEEEREL